MFVQKFIHKKFHEKEKFRYKVKEQDTRLNLIPHNSVFKR